METNHILIRSRPIFTVLVSILGIFMLISSLFDLTRESSGHLDVLLSLATIFLILCKSHTSLPSGAIWRPGVPIAAIGLFLLPPMIAPLVCVPGAIWMTGFRPGWLFTFCKTFAHISLGLYAGALTYHSILSGLPTHRFDALILSAFFALLIHLVVNRLIASAYVAEREGRSYRRQFSLTLRELHLGYPTAYLLSFLTAILSENEGILALVLGSILQFALFRSVAQSSKMYKWQQTALTDGLTKLGNRLSWDTFAKSFVTQDMKGTLAMIDLDNLKELNDSYGHLMGDAVLQDLGIYLQEDFPPDTQAFRYGGDEFVLFLPHESPEAEVVKARLNRTLESFTLAWARKGIQVGSSIGTALFPTDAENINDLFEIADTRMYVEKAIHRKTRSSI